jgi:hypothetical protein
MVQMPPRSLREQNDRSAGLDHPVEFIDVILEVDVLEVDAQVLFVRGIQVHPHPEATRGIGVVSAGAFERHDTLEACKGAAMQGWRIETSVAEPLHLCENSLILSGARAHCSTLIAIEFSSLFQWRVDDTMSRAAVSDAYLEAENPRFLG